MRIQKIVDLKGGEILAKTVMTPDYKILLSEGTKLRKDYIEKLGELGIREVFVEDEISTHEVKILKDETGKNFKDKVKEIIEKHTYRHSDELVELSKTADNIISNLLEEEEVIERMVNGKLEKYYKEVVLEEQAFIKENKITVSKYVSDNGGEILSMIRFAVGEGIEKKQENFAEEVMSQIKGA